MREGLRSSLAKLDVLEKGQQCGEKRKSEDDGKERSSKRACRNASKVTKYDCYSDSDNDADEDYMQQPKSAAVKAVNKPKVTLQLKTVTNYHGLKRKKLVEICSKEGLPTNGTDEELKKRHSEFITLYNSECDSEHPRSVHELVKEIKKRESGRKVCLLVQCIVC